MGLRACAVALWCALAVAGASAYTVDCNHEYTDCDTELSKIGSEDDESPSSTPISSSPVTSTSTFKPFLPTLPPAPPVTTKKPEIRKIVTTTRPPEPEPVEAEQRTEVSPSKEPRLLNLNVDELQNFANALHNESIKHKGAKVDLSDVNMDEDEEDSPRLISHDQRKHNKPIPDKFYTNLQVPFQGLLGLDARASEEQDTCKENEVTYKIGDRIDRGCEETCECQPGGTFECSPRCKHPYIRRGRRLTDPLCFESPVDECCSIVACATGNQEVKMTKVDICRYNNDTHAVGDKWHIGCEQTCSCEANSVVTCKPRCKKLIPSETCINVQDPNDECCEVQVCDVSQDAHEEPAENQTTSTTTTTTASSRTTTSSTTEGNIRGFDDYSDILEHKEELPTKPITFLPTIPSPSFPNSEETILPTISHEPIGSVKVLQNNSVQVNLMHLNSSETPVHLMLSSDGGKMFQDVELKYSNLILNLPGGKDYILKSKESGTKFNFTITSTGTDGDNETISIKDGEPGCTQDGKFYHLGEEFNIGCTKICECVDHNTPECVDLVCPSHVGLELVSKGCVRWAPNPPPKPPNCCPRTARCLSDGTCHYKGMAVPNWSEVPISMTGCEQRCFCENGELDCQEVCSPLPPVPPQTLRCPSLHHPAPVNISDEDCCKHWGCVPNAEEVTSTDKYEVMPIVTHENYVTPVAPLLPPTPSTTPLPTPAKSTPATTDFYRHLHPVKSVPKIHKTVIPVSVMPASVINEPPKYYVEVSTTVPTLDPDNITVFTLDELETPDSIQRTPPLSWKTQPRVPDLMLDYKKPGQDSPKYYSKIPDITNSVDVTMRELIQMPSSTPERPLVYRPIPTLVHETTAQTATPKIYRPLQRQQDLRQQVFATNSITPTPIRYTLPPTYFVPAVDGIDGAALNPTDVQIITLSPQRLFSPSLENRSLTHHIPKVIQSKPSYMHKSLNMGKNYAKHAKNSMHFDKNHEASRIKPMLPVSRQEDIRQQLENHQQWKDGNVHVLYKAPSPYESVLLRPVKINKTPKSSRVESPLGLDQIVSQLEVESEVNRNLGRSTNTKEASVAEADQKAMTEPSHPHSPFLPTVSPEIHFPDDIPDYDQNNLHKPIRDPNMAGLPPGFTIPPNYGEENKKLTVLSLQSESPTSVKLLFGLPPVLVGLRGSVDLRYTDKLDQDVSQWYSQIFAPADEVLTTPRLEFRLTGLKPSTMYKIKGKLFLHNLPVEPESQVYSIRTMDLPSVIPDEGKRRDIDSRLTVVDVNDTAAHVSWRHFTEDELQYIDGIQVRYRPMGTPIFSMTELLHHSRSIAELVDLRPGTKYEASLILVPPPRSTTELHDPGRVEFTTSPLVDLYNWSVAIEVRVVGSEAAELTWHGVPSPAERWVRVYRAAHACGASRHEHDAFRLATRDLPPTIMIVGLEPNTRCRVWLELFLTNGKIKTSNVIEVNTKSEDSPEDIDNEVEASLTSLTAAGNRSGSRGDYYGALVVVGVVAALGALTSLLLLLVLVRRHRPRSVPITPVPSAPRESSLPPYDNPAYKLELQQETMDL